MHRLRNKLILLFAVATLAPLLVTVHLSVLLLQRSLNYSSAQELDELSKSLQKTGRQLYQHLRDELKRDAISGRVQATVYSPESRAAWPKEVRELWDSGEPEHFVLSGDGGSRLDYLDRQDGEVRVYSRLLPGIRMDDLASQFRRARAVVETAES